MLAVGVAEFEVKVKHVPFPASLAIVAVTTAAVLNANPEGAENTIVPLPGVIERAVVSVMVGPVSVVYAPVPLAPFVSAEIAEPPVAPATVTAANAVGAAMISEATTTSAETTRRGMRLFEKVIARISVAMPNMHQKHCPHLTR